jgi:chromosome partitioning protein
VFVHLSALVCRCLGSPPSERPGARSEAMTPKIAVVHSRKGGVGKTTLAYELAYLLDAVLVDLDWEEGGATRTWGYRWEDRSKSPLLMAIDRGLTPKPLTGFQKADLVPSHPSFEYAQPDAGDMADILSKWAGEWGRGWVVVDTHPGATESTNGALAVAHVVITPVPLATKDLNGTEAMVRELADYPLVLVPNKIPPVPHSAEIQRLRSIVAGTPVQVGPPVPRSTAIETRKKRMAITSENPPAKALRPFDLAVREVAQFVKEYAGE